MSDVPGNDAVVHESRVERAARSLAAADGERLARRTHVACTDVVIPTVGHRSLALLLASLDGPPDRLPHRVIVVDDRSAAAGPLPCGALSAELRERLDVFTSGGRGPGAARNRGWHASRAEWIAFLDDDVIPCRGWLTELDADLDALPGDVAASQGRVCAPLAAGRPPTDREPNAPCVDRARDGANVAYRRSALLRVGGFDERRPRATSDDTDLVLRIREAGLRIVAGRRTVMRPPWPASRRAQANVTGAASRHTLVALAEHVATTLAAYLLAPWPWRRRAPHR